MLNASFKEKSAWVQILCLLVAFGFYFFDAARLLLQGVEVLAPFVRMMVPTVILLVITLSVGHALAAMRGDSEEAADERDRLIACRSEAKTSWIVGLGAFVAIGLMATSVANVWTANVLLLALVLSEVSRLGLQVIYYRRGVAP